MLLYLDFLKCKVSSFELFSCFLMWASVTVNFAIYCFCCIRTFCWVVFPFRLCQDILSFGFFLEPLVELEHFSLVTVLIRNSVTRLSTVCPSVRFSFPRGRVNLLTVPHHPSLPAFVVVPSQLYFWFISNTVHSWLINMFVWLIGFDVFGLGEAFLFFCIEQFCFFFVCLFF